MSKHKPRRKIPKLEQEFQDYISSLPDCLLVTILSLLPTKDAITTSVLSTRWQRLYTQLSHLSFSGPKNPTEEDQTFNTFLTTINHIFTHLTSPKLHKFHLTITIPDTRHPSHSPYESTITSWVHFICCRKPEDISVIPHSFDWCNTLVKIPYCIFQCNTIVSLNLSGGIIYNVPEEIINVNVNLPNLRKLEMCVQDLHKSLLITLFKSCPLLEELCLKTAFIEEGLVVEIICPNLKRFVLEVGDYAQRVDFLLNVPKVENLCLSGYNGWYRFVEKRFSGLVSAKFSMWVFECSKEDLIEQTLEVFKAICGVRFLDLDDGTLEKLGDGPLPVFHNLTELRISELFFRRVHDLFWYLSFCPNLEALVLCMCEYHKEGVHMVDLEVPDMEPACPLTKIRIFELKEVCVSDFSLDFLEFMLSNGSALEKVHVGVCKDGEDQLFREYEFCRKLFLCPRSSSGCEINFCGQYFTASSKSFKEGILNCQIRCQNKS